MMDEVIIEVANLDLQIGRRYLLKDIQWLIRKGENWLVFGENGSGKTTLLSLVAGYGGSLQGTVKALWEEKMGLAVRKQIGFVSSSFFDKVYQNETVLEIVLSARTGTLGVAYSIEDDDIIKAKELLRRFRLENYLNHFYRLLSKGQRQNVLWARAMMNAPDIYILDEPCSGLDMKARENMLCQIRQLAQDKTKTLIYVTHDAEEIWEDFEKVLLLKNGRIVQQGRTKDIMVSENLSDFLETGLTCSWIGGRLCVDWNRGEILL